MRIRISFRFFTTLLMLFTVLSILITPLIGSESFLIQDLWKPGIGQSILFELRFPRIIFAFLVGFSLALVGTIFQALLRNDLATPYTLGVSSGGALGAVLAIKLGLVFTIVGFPTTVFFSIMGSTVTIWIIYLIARRRMALSPVTLILAGVTVSLLFSSLILFIHYKFDHGCDP